MNFALTSTGDLDFSTGNLRLVTGAEEIAQKLKVRYGFFFGEWFLDTRLGVPDIQQLMEKGITDQVLRMQLQDVALTCPGVDSITEWTATRDATLRSVSIRFVAKLTDLDEPLVFDEVFEPRRLTA